jgi:hypothetical protein
MSTQHRTEHRQGEPLPGLILDVSAELTVTLAPHLVHAVEHVRSRSAI